MKYPTLQEACEAYKDTEESHRDFFESFRDNVNATTYLKDHRDMVEKYGFGYGDRPFHWAWKIVVDSLPNDFKFCEVGVFQGQTISLAGLIALETGKTPKIVGVTPLDNTGDRYVGTHMNIDYANRIGQIHHHFGVTGFTDILKGMSFDPRVQKATRSRGPYDCVYIDGCHDYEVVVDDLKVYGAMIKKGGILAIDDAGNFLKIPDGLIRLNFKGLKDVSQAAKDVVENNPEYETLFSVGHLRFFRRLV